MGGGFEALIVDEGFVDDGGHAGVLEFAKPTGGDFLILARCGFAEGFWKVELGGFHGLRAFEGLTRDEVDGETDEKSSGEL